MKLLILLGALTMMAATAVAQDFYVSPSGDDASPGTQAKPFRTLERARDAVRKVNGKMTKDIIVHIADGKYAITKTLEFGPEDSGSNGHKVIYQAVNPRKVQISGEKKITGWSVHDAGKNVFKASTSKGLFRQLYLNGERVIRSRTPNRESDKDLRPYWSCDKVRSSKPDIILDKSLYKILSAVGSVKERRQVEMVIPAHWYHIRIRPGDVKEVDEGMMITPVNPKGKFNKPWKFYLNPTRISDKSMNLPFYFENAMAFLDAEWEWYHNPETAELFLCLPKGKRPDDFTVLVPSVQTLVSLQGEAEKPVHDIEFRGIIFEYSNWVKPSTEGINCTQAVKPVSSSQPPGMIQGNHTHRIAIRRCIIRNAGACGIQLADADFSEIERCKLYNIAANGIDVNRSTRSNPTPEQQSLNLSIIDNEGYKCGQDYTNGMFLYAGNSRGMLVAHNLIYDLPYTGIQIGNQPGKKLGVDIGCGENKIRNNHIHHTNQLHGDGGGIYTLGGAQKGTVIEKNYLHNISNARLDRYDVSTIYLDNFTSAVLIRDNVTTGGEFVPAHQRNGAAGNKTENNPTVNKEEIKKMAGVRSQDSK